MEKLSELVNVLKDIDDVSTKILADALVIMKDIDKTNSPIIKEVLYRTQASNDEVNSYLQTLCLNLIEDAEVVNREIVFFAQVLEKSQKDIKNNIKSFPFLAKVWFGDTYDDKYGIEGLKILLSDLKSNLKNVNEDWIVETTVYNLTKENKKGL